MHRSQSCPFQSCSALSSQRCSVFISSTHLEHVHVRSGSLIPKESSAGSVTGAPCSPLRIENRVLLHDVYDSTIQVPPQTLKYCGGAFRSLRSCAQVPHANRPAWVRTRRRRCLGDQGHSTPNDDSVVHKDPSLLVWPLWLSESNASGLRPRTADVASLLPFRPASLAVARAGSSSRVHH